MVTILTLGAMLLAFALGAFTTAKCMQLGLKYQMQMHDGVKPELKPLEPIIQRHEAKKQNAMTDEFISEIWGGEDI